MSPILRKDKLEEITILEKIIEKFGDDARVEVVANVTHKDMSFPIHTIELGSTNPKDPVIAFFGGVHGLEKIGSELILAYMETLTSIIKWDEDFKRRLQHSRILFMPIVNPVGIWQSTRSNGNGVDLMRNSPSESTDLKSKKIYSGHRISSLLPWYRGEKGNEMEVEAKALCKVVKEKLFPAKISMAVDVHSGFGAKDRFWFPYSRVEDQFPYLAQVYALRDLFKNTYPHNVYTIEPVGQQYTIDGDLWDYLVDEFVDEFGDIAPSKKFFLPWTLEMGSWMWIRKNPLQIFNRLGPFHPIVPHRHQRIMRRHLPLFDFLHRSVLYPGPWLKLKKEKRMEFKIKAQEKWYAA